MSQRSGLPVLALTVSLFAAGILRAQEATSVQQLADAGRYVEAWRAAKAWAGQQPQNAEAQYWSGLTALRCGAYQEAETALLRALQIRPSYRQAAMALGERFDAEDRPAKAIEWFEKAWRMDERQAEPLVRIARVYQQNAAWKDAAKYYSQAQALGASGAVTEALDAARAADREQAKGVVSSRSLAANSRGVRAPAPEAAVPPPPKDAGRLAFQVTFPRNKSSVDDLSAEARAQLDAVATLLLTPDWQGKSGLVVEGHACTCGSAAANMELGLLRAQAIQNYLIGKGSLSTANSKAVSMGSTNPVEVSEHQQLTADACQRDAAHNDNRRVILKDQRAGAAAQVSFWYRPASGGEFRPLTNGGQLRSKDQIKVMLETIEPVYAYVFHHGSAGDWSVLFPNKQVTPAVPANPLPNGTPTWIPGPGEGLSLDETPGKEETLVFVSPGPDPDLENAVTQIRNGGAPTSIGSSPAVRPAKVVAQRPKEQKAPPADHSMATPPSAPPPPPVQEQSYTIPTQDFVIQTRGLTGVPAKNPGKLLLKLRSYASVKFDHASK
jgi:outer membrane protein OmpA-like peptidoglycan-associated protein